ncbi:MAG: Transcriptional regulator, AsnC family, partial [uncultured Nocardioidaceae bacterium]
EQVQRPRRPHALRARRRQQGHHRAAAAGRPAVVRRDRQGRGPVRGGGAPAGAAAHRPRGHAGRRGDRPARDRLQPPGDDRRPGQRRARPGGRCARGDGRGRLRRDHGGLVRPARRGRGRERRAPAGGRVATDPCDPVGGDDRDLRLPQAAQADLLVGSPV